MLKANVIIFNGILCIIITYINAARILSLFPVPSISHQVVFRPLTKELAKRGHDVTVVTTDPEFSAYNKPTNITEIDVHDISYSLWRKLLENISGNFDLVYQLQQCFMILADIVEMQLKTNEVKRLLNAKEKFDLLIVEACTRPILVFSYFHKVPVITISSFGSVLYNTDVMGIPSHPLLHPTVNQQKINNHTTWDKIDEIYRYLRLERFYNNELMDYENCMLQRVFGPTIPTIYELNNNIDLMFLNVHPILASNVPVPPNVIHIWGIHEREEKELPAELQSFLDASKKGVIYMSFGTNAVPSLLASNKIQVFIKVFSQLPYDILWKWDKDELPGQTENIRIGKWFPQSDLLRHPKVKLFITQGGLQSTEEAILAGVPLVGIPLLGDQWYNVEMYERHKIGIKLDIETLNENDVKHAVETVISNQSYRQNVKKLCTLMRDQPQSPLEHAVWWTEYVVRHGGAKHLRSPAANITWGQYYEIELVATILFTLVFTVTALLLLVRFVVAFVFTSRLKLKPN